MAYTNSSLITSTKLSPNYTNDRKCINRITIHHTATDPINASRIGEIFSTKKRGASCNYGIGNDGSICLIVEEKNRAWTSSNPTNDRSAITYEVSNSKYGEPWAISDKAMASIIALSIDVCKRNGITEVFNIQREIIPIAQANRAMFANNYDVPKGKCLLTQHNYFASTACPGTYLKDFDRWDYITNEINKGLKGVTPAPDPKPTPTTKYSLTDFRNDVCKILNVKTCKEAFEKTITISRKTNRYNVLVTPLERYMKSLGYYEGDIEADKGEMPIFGGGMETAIKTYQREVVKAIPKYQDGVLTKMGATWNVLLNK